MIIILQIVMSVTWELLVTTMLSVQTLMDLIPVHACMDSLATEQTAQVIKIEGYNSFKHIYAFLIFRC